MQSLERILENVVPLELMAAGETGQVVQVEGVPEMVHRLAEMGLREKASLRMVQPGSPCIVAVDENRLTLRSEADLEILVALAVTH